MVGSIATHRFFNPETQRALYERVEGYIDKEEGITEHIEDIKLMHGLDRLVRLDLGQNSDGCSPRVLQRIQSLGEHDNIATYLSAYPDFHSLELRKRIADLHGIRAEWILLSAGLEQMIDMIAGCFFESRDRFITTTPGFFLFDEFSRRHGGVPVEQVLHEEDRFSWTRATTIEFQNKLKRLQPKLVWLSNPNNPSGRAMDLELVEELVMIAEEHYVFVVIDEAYGEYTDPAGGVRSATSLMDRYHNLIVLRTFSKAFGLASLRVGYAMSGNREILEALRLHRPNYPITRLSFDLACHALDDIAWLDIVRKGLKNRREWLVNCLSESTSIDLIESESSIAMLRRSGSTADDLRASLEKAGIIVAPVPGTGSVARNFVRINIGRTEDIADLVTALGGMYH